MSTPRTKDGRYPDADSLERRLVGGERMTISIDTFKLRCAVLIEAEQAKTNPDNALIACLCEGIRLAREVNWEDQ